jgi:nitrogen regulatory protein P-II 1
MVKIEAIVQPLKLDEVRGALADLGITGVTIVSVLNHSGPPGLKARYRGGEYYAEVPKVKLEMVVSSDDAEEVIDVISRATRSGVPGDDGMILVSEIAEAIRLRNGTRFELVHR